MQKIRSFSEISKLNKKLKHEGRNIGLITGVFDIVHYGHVDLFRFAKRHVDDLVVAIDSDKTATKTKGLTRPIIYQHVRAQVLAEMESIDFVCPLKFYADYYHKEVDYIYDKIVKQIGPSTLITNSLTDKFWKNKSVRAQKLGMKFIPQQSIVFMGSSTNLIEKIRRL